MPYMPNAAPQGVDPYAQQSPDMDNMSPSLRRALEQAAARMVGEEPGPDAQDPRLAQLQAAQLRAAQAQAGAGRGARPVPGFEDVVARLISDPRLAAHLSGSQDEPDDDHDDDLGPADFGPPPYDPLERMKWDVAHGVHNQIAGARRARAARRQARVQSRAQSMQAGNQTFLRALAQSDPLFERTYQLLTDYLRHQPPAVVARLAPQVDQDPRKFLELYGQMRHFVTMSANQAQSQGQAMGMGQAPAPDQGGYPGQAGYPGQGAAGPRDFAAYPSQGGSQADPRAAVRRAVAGRMAAPALENPGAMDDTGAPQGSRQAQLAALKARMNTQGAGPGDLERYLDLLGVGERMMR